jgi:hypothetical protein
MRRNQITITIERFGVAAPNGNRDKISVYADSNNIHEALCAAFYEALDKIHGEKPLPEVGCRESQVCENSEQEDDIV